MALVVEGRIREPAAADAVVSDVRVSDDLAYAQVYLRIVGNDDAARRARVLDAMERASGYLRREVGKSLRLRHVPELRFEWDETIDHALRIEALLAEEGGAKPTEGS
jgi:ribosome-binding factor A